MDEYDVLINLIDKSSNYQLATLKSKPVDQQYEVIDEICKRNKSIATSIREKFNTTYRESSFKIELTSDDEKLSRIFVLMIALSDIASVPSHALQKPYMHIFVNLCRMFDIRISDVILLHRLLVE